MRKWLLTGLLCAPLVLPAAAGAHTLSAARAGQAAAAYMETRPGANERSGAGGHCRRLSVHALNCDALAVFGNDVGCGVRVQVRYTSHRSSPPRVHAIGARACKPVAEITSDSPLVIPPAR